MDKCIFCMIKNGELPSKIVYEDDMVLAFDDIKPQAPVHVVVIPKKHIKDIVELSAEDAGIIKAIMEACAKSAKIKGISDEGFRIISNCGENAGQTVMHMHFHVLGGNNFGEGIV